MDGATRAGSCIGGLAGTEREDYSGVVIRAGMMVRMFREEFFIFSLDFFPEQGKAHGRKSKSEIVSGMCSFAQVAEPRGITELQLQDSAHRARKAGRSVSRRVTMPRGQSCAVYAMVRTTRNWAWPLTMRA